MKIRYLLRKGRGNLPAYFIHVALYSDDLQERIPTGQSIPSLADWSKKNRAPKDHGSETFARIEEVKKGVLKAWKLLEANDQDVTPLTVKLAYIARRDELDKAAEGRDKKRKQDAQSVVRLCNEWVENNLFSYRPSTQKAIKESIKAFTDFLQSVGLGSIRRDELTHATLTRYERHLQDKKKLSNSTHGKRMKHLRWFLKSIAFDTSAIKIRTFKKPIISLDLHELEALEAVVAETPEEQRAKDMFLLGCYTGQRISDLKRISKTSIVDDSLVTRRQVKTGKEACMPLFHELNALMSRLDWVAPRITENDLNRTIKEVCRKAGITTLVEMTENKAGLNITRKVPKYKLITSHIAGKTCISTVCTDRLNLTPPETAAAVGKDLKTLMTHYFNLPKASIQAKVMEYNRAKMKVVA